MEGSKRSEITVKVRYVDAIDMDVPQLLRRSY